MPVQKSDLPFGSEFSPSQVSLQSVLELAREYGGNPSALQKAIQSEFFSEHGRGNADNQRKLAMNCRLGMLAYGLIDKEAKLTELGDELLKIKENTTRYNKFAAHILLNLNGMVLVRCIQEMTIAGDRVTLETLRLALEERGIHFPKGGKHPSMMRLWLEKAGVFIGNSWRVDENRIHELTGTDSDELSALAKFSQEQRAFLLALANTGEVGIQPANIIRDLAASVYGVRFPDKSLPKSVLQPLRDAGYITFGKSTEGRGAKPMLVAPTGKLKSDVIAPLFEQLRTQLDPKLLDLLKTPFASVVGELDSHDRYRAGLALEALAFKLMRLLGMDYIATRLRSVPSTGGAEIDLLFHSARLVYSRWQIQCKNTARVSLDDVAKEVGLTYFLKSNVIVMVSTGEISGDARRYANKVMQDSNLCIVMIDRHDIEAVKDNPASIAEAFKREASSAMALKIVDLGKAI